MERKLFLHEQADFSDLLRVVSKQESIAPQLIEKDYWLMHCLWALQSQNMQFELKGGTSLSKGWNIIERFSEDVDIKIFPPTGKSVPTGKNHDKPKHRTRRDEYFEWLKNNISVPGALPIERDREFDDRNLRNAGLRIHYPTSFDPMGSLKEGVLLEVGFDVTAPNAPLTISSWAYDFTLEQGLDILDNRALDVPCYYPEYTLVEKLCAISKKYRQEQEGKTVINFTRHYYDVYHLLAQPRILEFIGTEPYYEHKISRFNKNDQQDISKNRAFLLEDSEIRQRYADRYQSSAGFYFRGQPAFDAIIERIQQHAAKL